MPSHATPISEHRCVTIQIADVTTSTSIAMGGQMYLEENHIAVIKEKYYVIKFEAEGERV